MNGTAAGEEVLVSFWDLLLAAPAPGTSRPVATVRVLDDEFDFLAEPAQPSVLTTVAAADSPDPSRLATLAVLDAQLPAIARALASQADRLRLDVRLDAVDAAGALYLCRALSAMPASPIPEVCPLNRLLQRAVRSPDPMLAIAAAAAIGHGQARGAQLDLIARLHADPQSLGHGGVDQFLSALQGIADGRCVREMEALLVARGAELSDVHAWQARHIVQVIRRAGRK